LRILLTILIGLALGAAGGWLLAPRMDVPRLGKEELLRQRALEYYQASRRLDRLTMAQMFTPARQLEQADELRKEAEQVATRAAAQSEQMRKEAEETARGVQAKNLRLEIEGDWAVTSGSYEIVAFKQRVEAQLDRVAWVYDDGQWWQYNFELVERNAYGNPPDLAMGLDPWK
jgi:hypothetical protein